MGVIPFALRVIMSNVLIIMLELPSHLVQVSIHFLQLDPQGVIIKYVDWVSNLDGARWWCGDTFNSTIGEWDAPLTGSPVNLEGS